MTAEITTRLVKRAQSDWSDIAGESLSVEAIKAALYAFGSELGCLRLYHKMRGKGRVGFSQNMNSWYYELD